MSKPNNYQLQIGDRISDWEVVDPMVPPPAHIKANRPFTRCKCLAINDGNICGKIKDVNTYDLVKGNTKNCGCTRKKDVIGKPFGSWTVIDKAYFKHDTYYNCECECGNKGVVKLGDLTSGGSRSCGCKNKITTVEEVKRAAITSIFNKNKDQGRHYGNGDLPIGLCGLLVQLPCFYCGRIGVNEHTFDGTLHSDFVKENGKLRWNGLDRFSDKISKTHDMNNVVPACPQCNFFKLDRSYEEVLENIPKLNSEFVIKTLENINVVREEIRLLNEGKITAKYARCSTDLGKLYSSDFNSKITKFAGHRKEARYKNIPMNLSPEEIAELKLSNCIYCGKKSKLSSLELNEIDRISPGQNYDPSNCTTACRPCNSAKSILTLDQFREWIITIQSNFDNLPKTENEVLEMINSGYFIEQARKMNISDYFEYLDK